MKKIIVQVGSVIAGNSGRTNDHRRDVEFVGEELGSQTEYGMSERGGITDTRGVTETLYRTNNGRLVVHVKDWSHWQGEPSVYTLVVVTESDLQPGGRFEDLGEKAGYGRPLTLDEVFDEGE